MNFTPFEEIINSLNDLKEEEGINKTFKKSLGQVISLLQNNSQLVVEKALLALEELNTTNISSYHRTRVWEIASMLESL